MLKSDLVDMVLASAAGVSSSKGQSFERKGQTLERKGQTLERKGQTLERKGQTLERKGQSLERKGQSFAPSNIALVKYWGKCDDELNTPQTASLSVSLGSLGTETSVAASDSGDLFFVDGKVAAPDSAFSKRLAAYLDLFRCEEAPCFIVETRNSIPMGAGLASSASGFAALVLALDDLFGWGLSLPRLSLLARLGSGSACRSLYPGFVEWRLGELADTTDSVGVPLDYTWPGLRIGLLVLSESEKELGSRDAMRRTRDTSPLYGSWPQAARRDMLVLKKALRNRDFKSLGSVSESNALAMHAAMLAARPAISYWLPESLAMMRRVWKLRSDGLDLYFTMDAGPNLKLLYEESREAEVINLFPGLINVRPFDEASERT